MKVELKYGFLIFEGDSAIRLSSLQRVMAPRQNPFEPDKWWIRMDLVLQNEFKQPTEHTVGNLSKEDAHLLFDDILSILGKPFDRQTAEEMENT